MDDRKYLIKDLTMFHIMTLYDFMNPTEYWELNPEELKNRQDMAINCYNNDHIFRTRVDQIVINTLNIVDNYTSTILKGE